MNNSKSSVTVFQVPLIFDDRQLEKLDAYLTPEEQARAARYMIDRPRSQFVGCRVALKILIAQMLDCTVNDVRLKFERWGKPVLQSAAIGKKLPNRRNTESSGEVARNLHFNVSHSGEFGLIGFSRLPIGVDIEWLKPRISVASLSNIVLSATEREMWQSLPTSQREEQMLRLWVCKEALLKALGLGIAECLQQVSFRLPLPSDGVVAPDRIDSAIQIHLEEDANCIRNRWTSSATWAVRISSAIAEHVAAVAFQDRNSSVDFQAFEWSGIV